MLGLTRINHDEREPSRQNFLTTSARSSPGLHIGQMHCLQKFAGWSPSLRPFFNVVGPFPRCAGLRSSCASVTRSAGNLERYFLSINELNVLRVLPTVGRVESNPEKDWYRAAMH